MTETIIVLSIVALFLMADADLIRYWLKRCIQCLPWRRKRPVPPTRGYVKFRARVVNPDAMGVIYEPNRSVSMIDGHMENETGEEDEG